MNPAQQLKDIDRRAREAATAYKREAVALVAAVYEKEGSQAAAAKSLGITQGRVSQLLKERAVETVHHLRREDDAGVETRTVRVARYGDGAVEVHVAGSADGAVTGPERIEFASTPKEHHDAGEVEVRLREYLDDLKSQGFVE